jgi:hypothetical protein
VLSLSLVAAAMSHACLGMGWSFIQLSMATSPHSTSCAWPLVVCVYQLLSIMLLLALPVQVFLKLPADGIASAPILSALLRPRIDAHPDVPAAGGAGDRSVR